MAKNYELKFGSGTPTPFTGLTPTFIFFVDTAAGTTVAPPSISEILAGMGIYKFVYGPTASITFVVDGGAALSSGDRYISGVLDPIQAVDEKVGGIVSDSYGTTSVDPSTVFGYMKRNLEFHEGNMIYNKSTGVWDIYSRGSSTLIREKTLSNTTAQSTKT